MKTDKLIEQIKADREVGTQGKFCKATNCDWTLDTEDENAYFVVKGDHGPFAVVAVEQAFGMDDHNEADMRRVCNIPEMEARILADAEALKAADENLVKRLEALQTYFDLDEEELASLTKDERADTIRQHRLINEALSAYNEKRGERE